MSGYDEGIIEYGDGSTEQKFKRKEPGDYIEEKKAFLKFIHNFRSKNEADYRLVNDSYLYTIFN